MKSAKYFLLSFVLLVVFWVTAAVRPAIAVAAATMSLSPATKTVNVNDTFAVDVLLDTGSDAVAGVTAILTYDTAKLLVIDDKTGTDTSSQGVNVAPGTIFNQEPLTNTVDTTAGQIRFDSGSLGTTYNSNGGTGIVATIHFKALAEGTANVNFTFDAASTINTSLVAAASGPVNLLSSVNNGTYTITTAAQAPLPATGTFEETLVILVGGIALVGSGLFFARKAFLTS